MFLCFIAESDAWLVAGRRLGTSRGRAKTSEDQENVPHKELLEGCSPIIGIELSDEEGVCWDQDSQITGATEAMTNCRRWICAIDLERWLKQKAIILTCTSRYGVKPSVWCITEL